MRMLLLILGSIRVYILLIWVMVAGPSQPQGDNDCYFLELLGNWLPLTIRTLERANKEV